ncbi:MBL fold metallo-hydrolase [Kineothrix sp. MB12-C1]|uniref:MBL fold metallo-hydrolase n=1 Tax=Kineothrix sp. MB12-C1 TaxID=3070215 RepID=UPI0027D21B8A|nr:MBL fold metallo-hydrolase [Kineothrix sp. MB12-C1]WMC91866.1 MBL fold metallo-hydrolase [Kineothrix sp. MB12-C1]
MHRVIVLDITFEFSGVEDVIHPVVLQDENDTVLIDCGYIGFLPKIEASLLEGGIVPSTLTKVVITHHDHDHMGALADLKQKYPYIQVLSGEGEASYINGSAKSLRLEQAETMQELLSEEQKPFGEAFCELLRSVKNVKVDELVSDGGRMEWCGGCEIISTPGHTPGHISLYLPKHRTIIAGDAIVLEDGRPVIANPEYAINKEQAELSLEKLLGYDADRIICYHGGIYTR